LIIYNRGNIATDGTPGADDGELGDRCWTKRERVDRLHFVAASRARLFSGKRAGVLGKEGRGKKMGTISTKEVLEVIVWRVDGTPVVL
jgi:hypothetical protein